MISRWKGKPKPSFLGFPAGESAVSFGSILDLVKLEEEESAKKGRFHDAGVVVVAGGFEDDDGIEI